MDKIQICGCLKRSSIGRELEHKAHHRYIDQVFPSKAPLQTHTKLRDRGPEAHDVARWHRFTDKVQGSVLLARAILNSLSQMRRLNGLALGQVGDGAGQLEDAMEGVTCLRIGC